MNTKKVAQANIVIATLSVSLSASSALVPALSSMANAFPQWQQWVQLLITIPSLTMMFSSLLVNRLLALTSKKSLTVISLIVLLFSGVLPYYVHSFLFIIVSRVFMGLAMGVINTISSSLPANYFPESHSRNFATGLQSAFSSFGGILFSILSGWAAIMSWKNVFLVQYINLIPLFVACLLMTQEKNPPEQHVPLKQTKIKAKKFFAKEALPITMLSFICITLTCTYPLNLSMYIQSRGFGTTEFAGILTSINAFIGFFVGLFFAKMSRIFKDFTLSAGLLLAAAALFIIGLAPTSMLLLLGSILFGIGTSLIYPAFLTKLYKDMPPQHLVVGVGMFSVGSNLSQFFSPFLINPIAELFNNGEDTRILVAGVGVLIVALTLIIINVSNKSDSLPIADSH